MNDKTMIVADTLEEGQALATELGLEDVRVWNEYREELLAGKTFFSDNPHSMVDVEQLNIARYLSSTFTDLTTLKNLIVLKKDVGWRFPPPSREELNARLNASPEETRERVLQTFDERSPIQIPSTASFVYSSIWVKPTGHDRYLDIKQPANAQ